MFNAFIRNGIFQCRSHINLVAPYWAMRLEMFPVEETFSIEWIEHGRIPNEGSDREIQC